VVEMWQSFTIFSKVIYRKVCQRWFSRNNNNRISFSNSRGSQRNVVYLGWLRAHSYMSLNAGVGGELRGHSHLSQWVQLCTWSPTKLWRSNSIFNLCLIPGNWRHSSAKIGNLCVSIWRNENLSKNPCHFEVQYNTILVSNVRINRGIF
jgi:hypothetical protein